jgi:type II secretory pathway predicted ATPase ExeA
VYREHFKLSRMPFDNTPDPRFFYMTAAHEEAVAALSYGVIQERGATVVTGAPGCGKTLLGQMLVQSIQLRADTATLNYTPENPHDLLTGICRELGLRYRSDYSTGELVDRLRQNLRTRRAEGRCVVLLVDEAQNLSLELLEHLRMLGNLELDTAKLLQIVLLGQPELAERLHDPRLEQFRQRIYCWRALEPLSREDTAGYLEHRLRAAGAQDPQLFTEEAVNLIYERSGGIPRLINQLADNSMLVAYSATRPVVDRLSVNEAVQQMLSVSTTMTPEPGRAGEAGGARQHEIPAPAAVESAIGQASWQAAVSNASELAGRLIELVRAGNQHVLESAQTREALLSAQREAAGQLERLHAAREHLGAELSGLNRKLRRQMAKARRIGEELSGELRRRAEEAQALIGQGAAAQAATQAQQDSLQECAGAAEQARVARAKLEEILSQAERVTREAAEAIAGAQRSNASIHTNLEAAGALDQRLSAALREAPRTLQQLEALAAQATEARNLHEALAARIGETCEILGKLSEQTNGPTGVRAALGAAESAAGKLQSLVAEACGGAAEIRELLDRAANAAADAAELRQAAQAAAEARQEIERLVELTDKAGADVRLAFTEYNVLRSETAAAAAAVASRLEELVTVVHDAGQARTALARESDRGAETISRLQADAVAAAAQAGKLATHLAEATAANTALRQAVAEASRLGDEIGARCVRERETLAGLGAELQAAQAAIEESVGSAQLLQEELSATMDRCAERVHTFEQQGERHAQRARQAADSLSQTMQTADAIRADCDAAIGRSRQERAQLGAAADQAGRLMAALASRLEAGEALLTELVERSRRLGEQEQAGMQLRAEAEQRLQAALSAEARLVELAERIERERTASEQCAERLRRERLAVDRAREKTSRKFAVLIERAEAVMATLQAETDQARQATLAASLQKAEADVSGGLLNDLVEEVNALCAEFEAVPAGSRRGTDEGARSKRKR